MLPALAGCGSEELPGEVVGTLEWDRVELIAEVSEPIVAWEAREGDRVEPGQVLVRLDPARREARLEAARAERARAAARLLELERGPRQEDIRAAEARYAGADRVLDVRQRDYRRVLEVQGRGLASPSAVDQARAALDAARAERDAALELLRELREGTRPEALEQARQSLEAAEADLRAREVDLGRLTVRAPVAGRLDSLPLPPGNQPQAGAVVAVLLSGERPYARVYIPELLRARVQPGDPARVRVDGIAEGFAGRVRWVSADPVFTPFYALTERDRKRLSYPAKIDLPDTARDFYAGLPVQAELPRATAPAP